MFQCFIELAVLQIQIQFGGKLQLNFLKIMLLTGNLCDLWKRNGIDIKVLVEKSRRNSGGKEGICQA